jgi:hypothetical protein
VAPAPIRPGKGEPGANNEPRDLVADKHANEELAEQCGQLEEELERLRARYEMYFLGVERREPNRERDELKRRIERIKTAFTRNTGLKFRLQTLAARYLSYERMWVRSAREKEEGTYRRDLFKARRHAQERGTISESSAPSTRKKAGEAPAPAADAPEPATAPPVEAAPPVEPPARIAEPPPRATEPPARAAPPPARPPPAAAGPAVGDAQLRAIYDAYVAAKVRCNEDVSRLTFEAVAKSVQKQVPELMAKYKARSVEFKVVIQGGKALLKAVPKT